jgi:hypothetical protein
MDGRDKFIGEVAFRLFVSGSVIVVSAERDRS